MNDSEIVLKESIGICPTCKQPALVSDHWKESFVSYSPAPTAEREAAGEICEIVDRWLVESDTNIDVLFNRIATALAAARAGEKEHAK